MSNTAASTAFLSVMAHDSGGKLIGCNVRVVSTVAITVTDRGALSARVESVATLDVDGEIARFANGSDITIFAVSRRIPGNAMWSEYTSRDSVEKGETIESGVDASGSVSREILATLVLGAREAVSRHLATMREAVAKLNDHANKIAMAKRLADDAFIGGSLRGSLSEVTS